MLTLLIAYLASSAWCAQYPGEQEVFNSSFVAVNAMEPGILVEMRYFGDNNFLGRKVAGYSAARCLLTKPAAQALAAVQRDLREFSLSLRVYDCYRPQRAVDDFVQWAKDLSDARMKKTFYPDVDKKDLFKEGYIAAKSGHSRGSTLDLTIDGLDMGTAYDYFDKLAHTLNPAIGAVQKANRALLKLAMEKHGFKNLPDEWWHFTLKDEPFPGRYFDVPIE